MRRRCLRLAQEHDPGTGDARPRPPIAATTSSATIALLPQELISLVAEMVYYEDRASMSTVCRAWRDPAQRALFGEVDVLDFVPTEARERVEQWKASAARERYQIRYLSFSQLELPDALLPTLKLCSGLRSSRIVASWPVACEALCSSELSSMRRLSLSAWDLDVSGEVDPVPATVTLPFQLHSLNIEVTSLPSHNLLHALFYASSTTLTSLSIDIIAEAGLPTLLKSLPLVALNIKHLTLPGRLHQPLDLSFLSTFTALGSLTLASPKPAIDLVLPLLPPSVQRLAIVTIWSSIPKVARAIEKLLPALPATSALRWIDFSPVPLDRFDRGKNAGLLETCRKREVGLWFSDGWIL